MQRGGRYGCMTALRSERIVEGDLVEALAAPRALDQSLYETAAAFFG